MSFGGTHNMPPCLMTTQEQSKALYIFRIMMYTHKQQTFVYHNKTLVVTLL